MLRDALYIGWHDLKVMIRQKDTILWTFLMPFLFFYFLGTVTGGFSGGGASSEKIAVRVAPDAGFRADEVQKRLEEQDFQLVRPDEDPEAETPFEDYRRRLEFPAGFTAGVLAGEPQDVLFRREGAGLSTDYDNFRLTRAVYTVLADLLAASSLAAPGADVGAEEVAALQAHPRALQLEVEPAGRRKVIPSGMEQTVPGTMVMFTMIILLTSGGSSLLTERREGLLRRLASAPISRSAVVAGKWGGRLALGLVQIAYAMLIGRIVFGVDWGAGLPMVLLVLLAYASMLSSLAILLGNFARSEGQAVGLSVLATNILAALGGCWWPIEITPSYMQKLALFLPTGWTMDAMHKLVSFGAPMSSCLPHVVGMLLLALLLGKLSARTFRFVE
ncbi:MAG: ABC transporter permease [Planctomycetota bacterium]